MTKTERGRYGGFAWSLDYRPHEKAWDARYRVRILPTKQERQEFRIVAYGVSEDEAHANARRLYEQAPRVNE